jgi:hypothetical protein
MPENNTPSSRTSAKGDQPLRGFAFDGYQPLSSLVDKSKPPRGGSGVPSSAPAKSATSSATKQGS